MTARQSSLPKNSYGSDDLHYNAIRCMQDNNHHCKTSSDSGQQVRPWWEVEFEEDTPVYKVELEQCAGADHKYQIYKLNNLDIQLISSDDVLLATGSTKEGLATTSNKKTLEVRVKGGGFERNACIEKCRNDFEAFYVKERNMWQESQPGSNDAKYGQASREYIAVFWFPVRVMKHTHKCDVLCTHNYNHSYGL